MQSTTPSPIRIRASRPPCGGGAATLTTVGYGDAYPITLLGKLMASIIAILGIGVFALPTGIFGAGFVEELDARKKARRCPHC